MPYQRGIHVHAQCSCSTCFTRLKIQMRILALHWQVQNDSSRLRRQLNWEASDKNQLTTTRPPGKTRTRERNPLKPSRMAAKRDDRRLYMPLRFPVVAAVASSTVAQSHPNHDLSETPSDHTVDTASLICLYLARAMIQDGFVSTLSRTSHWGSIGGRLGFT